MAKAATDKQLDYIIDLAAKKLWEKTRVRDSVKRVLAGELIHVDSASRAISVLKHAEDRPQP